jgi:hypothetical protein
MVQCSTAARAQEARGNLRGVPIATVPTPLAEMYADVLRGQGVPVMLRTSGAGRGALGGVPVAVDVLVSAEEAVRARDILGIEAPGHDSMDERKDRHSR